MGREPLFVEKNLKEMKKDKRNKKHFCLPHHSRVTMDACMYSRAAIGLLKKIMNYYFIILLCTLGETLYCHGVRLIQVSIENVI